MTAMPSGTVTFLFTDLEGSTRLWEEHPEAMRDVLARHDEILRDAVEARDGVVVKTTGDGLHAVFASARDALGASVDAQLALGAEDWALSEPVQVRMGMHTGEAEGRGGDYYGPAVNRAARVSAAGHGGQILLSHATEELVRDDLPAGAGLVDLGEHRLRDLERPERVFQVTHAGLIAEFAPVRSLDAYPTNLPVARTSFVGREREVADIAGALASGRLVTLTGVGGVGKTRLALRVAAEVLPHRADGVWVCELAPVSEADGVLDAIASAVRATTGGMASGPSLPARDLLVRHLARREVLLVLDNCEQVLGAVAEVVDDLLTSCPGVRVLATSREGLGLAGEQIVAVGTLGVPAADAPVEVRRAGDAVQLFVDRAGAAKRGFAVTDENLDAVVEVCRRLDGIPLAIELAAARVRMLTPAQIAARLDERFRLLTGSTRGTVSRHQTLRAAIDWSYDQLEPAEQSVLARLAVFAGAFDLGAAEVVAADGEVDAIQVFDVVGQLVDKSLVVATETDEGMAFRLLETIRQYAEERLDDAGEIPATRTRHAHHYLDLLERAAWVGGDPLADVAGDFAANVHVAFEWLVIRADPDPVLRLVVALGRLEGLHGHSGHAVAAMMTTAVGDPGAMAHPLAPAALAGAANWSLRTGGDPVDAHAATQRSLHLAEELGLAPSATHLVGVAAVALLSGHVDEARAVGRRAVAVGTEAGDDRGTIWAYVNLISSERLAGHLDAAIDAGARAEEVARRFGATDLLGVVLTMQGYVLRDVEPDRALRLLDEGALLAGSLSNDARALMWNRDNAGLIRLRMGDTAAARRDFTDALDLAVRVEHDQEAAAVWGKLAVGLLDVGDATDARTAAILIAAGEHLVTAAAFYAGIGVDEADLSARLVAALGAEALAEMRARGAVMGFDETVALARSALARVAGDGGAE